jgi:hypothetical protein
MEKVKTRNEVNNYGVSPAFALAASNHRACVIMAQMSNLVSLVPNA